VFTAQVAGAGIVSGHPSALHVALPVLVGGFPRALQLLTSLQTASRGSAESRSVFSSTATATAIATVGQLAKISRTRHRQSRSHPARSPVPSRPRRYRPAAMSPSPETGRPGQLFPISPRPPAKPPGRPPGPGPLGQQCGRQTARRAASSRKRWPANRGIGRNSTP
jgi:hypothetical protein